MSALRQQFINSIYDRRADYIRPGLISLRSCSIDSKQQLVERLYIVATKTMILIYNDQTTPASSDGVAPMPASHYLPNQEDVLMDTFGDNWDGNQTHLKITDPPARSTEKKGDNFPVSTIQTSTAISGAQLQLDVSTKQQPAISAGQSMGKQQCWLDYRVLVGLLHL